MRLSNMFNNRLDDFVDSSNEENVISHRQNRNATSPQLPGTERSRVVGHSRLEKGIEDTNGDIFDVSFHY